MRSNTRLLMSGATLVVLATAGCADGASPTSLLAPPTAGPELSVTAGSPVALTVTPSLDTLAVGATLQLVDSATDRRGRLNSTVIPRWVSVDSTVARVTQDGLVTGLKVGVTRVKVTVGSLVAATRVVITAPVVVVTPPPAPTPTPVPGTGSWTYCSKAGTVCEFIGLRDVRLADATGTKAVTQVAYHSVPCAVYGFNNQNPGGTSLHCDYGPIKMQTLANPMPGMGLAASTVTVAMGSPGSGEQLTRSASDTPVYTDGSGSFRTTCSLAGYAFNDPIVFPGKPGASHLHQFFGNTSVNANSTPESLAASGNSTCRGGTLNRTTYWVPALIDSRTGEVQTPAEGVFYYKTGYDMDPKSIKPFPAGLRMIAGNRNATSQQDFYVDWGCRDKYINSDGAVPTSCPVGDAIRLAIIFPQCWDGKNLDSPDHKSHMAYPIYSNTLGQSHCPADHPVPLPAITEHFDYPITASSQPQYWRLTSDMYSTSIRGGYSAHADWMGAWDQATMNTIVTQCLNKAVDCGVGSIGNGKELYQ